MARSPIEIAIASETKAFKQGILTGIIDPLEDAIKKLRDLGDTDGADKLERELKAAQHATENLSDETKRTAAAIEREYRDAYRSARQASDEGTGRMREGAKEVQQEVGQNLGEAVSSLRGNLSDLGQVGQDTLGGLAATVAGSGPAGLVGALALAGGAAGLGLLTAGLQEAEEKRQELAARASDLAKAYVDAGTKVLDTMTVAARVSDVLMDDEQRQKAEDYAKALGVDLPTAARAMAGDLNALGVVQQKANEAERDYAAAVERTGGNMRGVGSEYQNYVNGLKSARDAGAELTGVVDAANKKFDDNQQALRDMVKAAGSATEEIDAVGNKLLTLPDKTQVLISADTGEASLNVERFQGDVDGVITQLNSREVQVAIRADTRALKDATAAYDALQKRAASGINIAFNNTGRQLLQ